MAEIAIVTGGAGSIGWAACQRLVADGWVVVAADTRPPAERLPGCTFAELDVRSLASVGSLFDSVASLGTVRALVTAHGILRETQVGNYDEDAVSSVVDINLTGVARLCNVAAQRMADHSAMVLISSVTARMGRAHGAFAYQATKGGVESLTRALAVALGPRELRVNCVAPGYLSVPMRGEGAAVRARHGGNEPLLALTPFKRLVTPEEVADVIAYLCSPRSSGVSGTVIPVDGGESAF